MTVYEIDKILEHLDGNRLEELRKDLRAQRNELLFIAETPKAQVRTIMRKMSAVKKYLNYAKDVERPKLSCINHTKKNEPFVCNAYTLIKWNEGVNTDFLRPFEQLEPKESVGCEAILERGNWEEEKVISEKDLALLKNVGKYVKYYGGAKQKQVLKIKIFGSYFDARLLRHVVNITGGDFTEVSIQKGWMGVSLRIIFKTNENVVLLLPLRSEADAETDARTERFIKQLEQLKAA